MPEVQSQLRKLQPVLGRTKVQALWAMYLASEEKDKRRWMETIALLSDKYARDDYQEKILLPPPAPELCAGEYPLGTVWYPEQAYSPFGIREHEWIKHIGIFGVTGSGKTNCACLLLSELLRHGRPFLICDWKKNYRDLLAIPEFKDELLVFTAGKRISPFRFNPLIPPPGTDPKVWLKKLIEIIEHAFFVGEGVAYIFKEAIDQVYRDYGIYAGTNTSYPTFLDVEHAIAKRYRNVRGREMLWLASARRTLASLNFGPMSEVVNAPKPLSLAGLLNQNVAIELDALSEDNKTFLVEALILWIYHYRLEQGKREEFKHCLVIEEAHNILLKKKQERQGRETIMDFTLRMIRELGEAFILIDQHPSLISVPALGNTNTTISFNLKHGNDVQGMSKAMLLKPEEQRYLGQLGVGDAIVKIQDRYPEPFLVRVPLFALSKGQVSDKAVGEHMQHYPLYSADSAPIMAEFSGIRGIQAEDTLSPLETIMLRNVAEKPFWGTAKRYQKLGLSAGLGNKVKNDLVVKGLVKPVTVNGLRLLETTECGKEVLEKKRIPVASSRGHRSLEHEYWKDKVARHLSDRGYTVAKEQDGADIIAHKGQERIAIEVETGKSAIDRNALKHGNKGFTAIVFLGTRREVLPEIEKALSELREHLTMPILVMDAKSFLRDGKL